MKYRDLAKAYQQKYVAREGSQWYLITETALVVLNSSVTDSLLVLELSEITNGWTISPNYKLLTAQSLMRQLDRLPSKAVLIQDNLIAFNDGEKNRILWANIPDAIDVPRLLSLEFFGDNPASAALTLKNALTKIKKNIMRDWADSKLNRLANEIVYSDRIAADKVQSEMDQSLSVSKYNSLLVAAERALFDYAVFHKLSGLEIDKLEHLLGH